jgi:isopenicillin-N N-acyltransferase-like protein
LERELKVIRAEGSPFDLGHEHGYQCRDLIRQLSREDLPREMAVRGKVDPEAVKRKGLDYRPYIETRAPHLLEEIRGIADGAGIEFEEALALQCRSELVSRAKAETEARSEPECTSFAISKDRSATGEVIVGQNLDLAPAFEPSGVVLFLYPKGGPAIITWTLAGTVGQVGLNSAGLARCGNFLLSPGWRVGLPTTILWRLILEQPSVAGVETVIADSYRAKSNNFVVGDSAGTIADFEATVDAYRRLEPENGAILHSNHYLHPDLLPSERQTTRLPDSQARLARLSELFRQAPGKLGSDQLQTFLRDHSGRPHCICKHDDYSKTVVSVISHPKAGRIEICSGNPCQGEYLTLRF